MRLAIATPVLGPPTWALLDSLLGLHYPPGWEVVRVRNPRPAPVDVARNLLVQRALKVGCDYVLWVDGDAELHPETLPRLLSWDVSIVGALCFTKTRPPMPTVYQGAQGRGKYRIQAGRVRRWLTEHPELWEHGHQQAPACLPTAPAEALTPVDFTGCHALLMRTEVLRNITPPWFAIDPEAEDGAAEDRVFCEKARAVGYPVFVDLSVIAGHTYGEGLGIGALDFLAWDRIVEYQEPE